MAEEHGIKFILNKIDAPPEILYVAAWIDEPNKLQSRFIFNRRNEVIKQTGDKEFTYTWTGLYAWDGKKVVPMPDQDRFKRVADCALHLSSESNVEQRVAAVYAKLEVF